MRIFGFGMLDASITMGSSIDLPAKEDSKGMAGYPIQLDLAGRTVLVVGLGAVGSRKAIGLIEAGASVLGVDPGEMPGPPGLIRERRSFRPEDLEGVALAFACAVPEVNRDVVRAAKSRGVWVNSASDPDAGDFVLPASERLGPLTISVSTDGRGPALAALVRDLAVEVIGPEVIDLAEVLAELRPEVIARVRESAARARLLKGWASRSSLALIRERGVDSARRVFRSELESAIGTVSDSLSEA